MVSFEAVGGAIWLTWYSAKHFTIRKLGGERGIGKTLNHQEILWKANKTKIESNDGNDWEHFINVDKLNWSSLFVFTGSSEQTKANKWPLKELE